MRYHEPYGAAANAPYINGNPATGVRGSVIPAEAIEYPQREQHNLISNTGLTPADSDLHQVSKAIQSGQLNAKTSTGTSTAWTIAVSPSPNAYYTGMRFNVKLNADITGITTLAVNSLGAKFVRHPGGRDLFRYDYLSGDVVHVIYDATTDTFLTQTPINFAIIDTATTRTFGSGGDFPDLPSAVDWIGRRRISSTGTFIMKGRTGQQSYSARIVIQHPDSGKITLQGNNMLSAAPTNADFTVTGSGSSARASDTAANLSMARGRYATELVFSGTAGLTVIGSLSLIKDLLISSTGSGANLDLNYGAIGIDNVMSVGGSVPVSLYSVYGGVGPGPLIGIGGSSTGMVFAAGTKVTYSGNLIAHSNASSGFGVGLSYIFYGGIGNVFCRGNAGNAGFYAQGMSYADITGSVISNNAGDGAICSSNSVLYTYSASLVNNGGLGLRAQFGGIVETAGAGFGPGNGLGSIQADWYSLVRVVGTSYGGSVSPSPVNTWANAGSLVSSAY